jgi:hypothetical protein
LDILLTNEAIHFCDNSNLPKSFIFASKVFTSVFFVFALLGAVNNRSGHCDDFDPT